MAANTSDEQHDKVPLRVLVDKEKNKVVYAEAGKDFVDVLLSFLTLPLGTIARLVAKESNIEPVRVGSLSSLYQSVADLKEEYLFNQTCKEMLLKPMNSMEAYCRHMKLNIDNREPTQYFSCCSAFWNCFVPGGLVSTFRNQECSFCERLMTTVIYPNDDPSAQEGFVKETATFIIADDLYVMPNDIGTSLKVLQMHGINDIEAIEKKTILIGKKEVVDILKLSLLSKTPLTDFILRKKQFLDNFNPGNQSESEIGDVTSDEGRQIDVKVMVRKSNGEIMFAEAGEDFVDFLFSFLTFPLGGVLHMLEGFSSLSCIDNLYKSLTEFSLERYLRVSKYQLAMPRIAQPFELKNQILPIDVAPLPLFNPDDILVKLDIVDPKSYPSGGFAASGPLKFMVTDDLVVTPMSSISGISYLERMKVPLNDLEERVISIGKKEGLVILKASLTSTSALTKAVDPFRANLISKAALTDSPICHLKKPKEENEA